ncbi:hypothetical protein D1007_38632 [Hordeum vulgare]|nr:hypothetical protein D1007_38632 [Hordeum vulgare]
MSHLSYWPRVWVRYTLAYLALALTIADQYWMYLAHGSLFPVADPGPGDCFSDISCAVDIVLCVAGDVLFFLLLLLGPLLGDR